MRLEIGSVFFFNQPRKKAHFSSTCHRIPSETETEHTTTNNNNNTKTTPPSYENLNKRKLMHVFELSSSQIKTIF